MIEDSVQVMRETKRNVLVLNRRKNRDDETDTRRSLRNISPIRTDLNKVLNIASKLKTKSNISASELQILKNALIGDVTNIERVLNINGALRGIVRELTGHDVTKQCAAAGCSCNLALGDSRAGLAVSKAAGSYLVAGLDNLTTELAVTSAWTIGNLAGSGTRACELLTSQGAVSKLIGLLESSNEEMVEAVLYAIVRIVHQMKDDLRPEHLQAIISKLTRLDISTTANLLFILSCHKDFTADLISQELISKILQFLAVSIQQIDNENVTYVFRFLANSYCKELYYVILHFFIENNLLDQIKLLLENGSVLWFLGNAYKLCSDNMFFELLK